MSVEFKRTAPPEPADSEEREAFKWDLVDAADTWTDDSSAIAAMSDRPIIEGLLREGEVASVVGGAKSCKTWFSLALGLAVASGNEFMGFATHQHRTLYLDYELKKCTFEKRMCMLACEQPVGFYYQLLRGQSGLPTVEDIEKVVEEKEIGLVVVDSLYRTGWLSEENSNDSTGKELSVIQKLVAETGATILVSDHTAKGGGEGRSAVDASRGASAKGGFFDTILVLRPTDQGPDPEGNYVILDPVVRDWPRFRELPLMSFSWTETRATIKADSTVEAGATNTDTTVIMGALAECDKPVGVKFVAGQTGLSEKRIRTTLAKLAKTKRVVDSPDPKHSQRVLYRLVDLAD